MNDELIIERHGPVARLDRQPAGSAQCAQHRDHSANCANAARPVAGSLGAGFRAHRRRRSRLRFGRRRAEFREQLATPEVGLELRCGCGTAAIGAARGTAAGHRQNSGPRGRKRHYRGRFLRFSHCRADGEIRHSGRQIRFPCSPFPTRCDWCNLSAPAKAKWLLMTGQLIEAPEAQAIGLVDQVVDAGASRCDSRTRWQPRWRRMRR